ncbi:hypothetical protein QKU48_gp1099 [Fadolivirus algeromassiliense]|jgi:hypothetical protein|uniref:Uncharacterized protein n=1 Tax=Fadolivirus FV1/VV64 TaxID=3070911 RepID=A0A7D3V941_9VIRU|nr:hypothetical protein QKU48_gp1099 [Fadolivirus algeromassiliense]QKF94557.1 hypothetical protein Fadolivirus_1_1099 [Fadolivirus FV1/VV64]
MITDLIDNLQYLYGKYSEHYTSTSSTKLPYVVVDSKITPGGKQYNYIGSNIKKPSTTSTTTPVQLPQPTQQKQITPEILDKPINEIKQSTQETTPTTSETIQEVLQESTQGRKIDCIVGDWQMMGCVDGQRKYSRYVTQQPENGGIECPTIMDKFVDDDSCGKPYIVTYKDTHITTNQSTQTIQSTPQNQLLRYAISFASMSWCMCFVALLVAISFFYKKN